MTTPTARTYDYLIQTSFPDAKVGKVRAADVRDLVQSVVEGTLQGPRDEDVYLITPTVTLSATLTPLINAGWRRFELLGDCTLESALPVVSGLVLKGQPGGRTTITRSVAGDPLAKINAMFLAQGALNTAKLNSTPTNAANGGVNYYPPGSDAVSVAALGTLAAGDWVVYDGHNDGAVPEYYGGGAIKSRHQELVQVDSISTLTLRLKTHLLQYHTLTNGGTETPVTVKGCDPITGVVLEDLTLDGNGCANGVLCEYAADFAFRRVEFKNFARYGVEWTTASVGLLLQDCVYESCNAAVGSGMASGHRVSQWNCRTTGTGSRYLATGRIRGMTHLREMSAEWMMVACDFSHVALPVHLQSSRNFTAIGCRFRDSDVNELLARDLAAADFESRAEMGAGIDMGSVSLDYSDWSVGTVLMDCVVEDAIGDAPGGNVSAVWLHDHRAMKISGLRVQNTGKSPYATIDGVQHGMQGLRLQDAEFDACDVSVVGCQYSLIRNSSQGERFRGLHIYPVPSSGTIPTIGLYLYSDPTGFLHVWDLDCNVGIYFAPGFGANVSTDYRTHVDRARFDGDIYTAPLVLFKNVSGSTLTWGHVVELDATLTDGSVKSTGTTPTTGATAVGVVAMPELNTVLDNGFGFLAVGQGHKVVKVDASEYRPGMLLRAAGGGTHNADSVAAPGDARVGMVTSYKAAGAAGWVRVS